MTHFGRRYKLLLRAFLERLHLLGVAQRFWHKIVVLSDPYLRKDAAEQRRKKKETQELFRQFKQEYGEVLGVDLKAKEGHKKKALVLSTTDFPSFFQVELTLVKALELANYEPAALIIYHENEWNAPDYYELTGIQEIYCWSKFIETPDLNAASKIVNKIDSIRQFVAIEHAGTRVGKFAYATALRQLRQGSLNIQSPSDRQILTKFLSAAIAAATAVQKLLQEVRPDIVFLLDSLYTPEGELVDGCLKAGIEVIMYALAHKSSALIFKRYSLDNRDDQPASLSKKTWQLVQNMTWTETQREQLQQELYGAYASGDWYSVALTQFDKSFIGSGELRKELRLDPTKKTAFIFPHISWDASLMWGEDLFKNYEEWFTETVKAACLNTSINWVIKIHPAHAGKNLIEGKHGEPVEVTALRKQVGELPSHVFMIPAESKLSTFSLFEIMDYCLTVRGTVGIEAARFGIPVLTAGTGRFDRKGFTVDSDSREQYLENIAHIQDIPRLPDQKRRLAERFAYGLFLLRPLPMTSVSFKYHKDYGKEKRFLKTHIHIGKKEDWFQATDLMVLSTWINDSSQQDFLMPLPVDENDRIGRPVLNY